MKQAAVEFLDAHLPAASGRNACLMSLPTHLLVLLPLWGLSEHGRVLGAADFVTGGRLTTAELKRIGELSGEQALLIAGKEVFYETCADQRLPAADRADLVRGLAIRR